MSKPQQVRASPGKSRRIRATQSAHLAATDAGAEERGECRDRLPLFDGKTFDDRHDGARLRTKLEAVRRIMADGRWRTLPELRAIVGGSEAGLSARLRDLRKPRHGGMDVEKRRRENAPAGLWEYRVRSGGEA